MASGRLPAGARRRGAKRALTQLHEDQDRGAGERAGAGGAVPGHYGG